MWRIIFWYTCQLLPRCTRSFFLLYCYCYTVAFYRMGICHGVCISWHADVVGCVVYEEGSGILISFSCFDEILHWMPLFQKLLCCWIRYPMWYIYFIRERDWLDELILTIHSYLDDRNWFLLNLLHVRLNGGY